ncbi:hypothetical protein F4819DRAFT_485014 [Hypoxylon fuscum]|nr:hypothetical protein F4819DRAFT_485014 [Hypoxylon fuscum]
MMSNKDSTMEGKSPKHRPSSIVLPENVVQEHEKSISPGPRTGSSLYSCPELPDKYKDKWIKAKDARQQVAEAPATRPRIPDSKKKIRGQYPKNTGNKKDSENFLFESMKPRKEFPILQGEGKKHPGYGDPGAIRAVYNNNDREKFNVVYHSSNEPGKYKEDLKLATYRPSQKP